MTRACYLCLSSYAQLRDLGGIKIQLCAGCLKYVQRVTAKRVRA